MEEGIEERKKERKEERKGRDPGDGSISSWHFLGACSSSSTSVQWINITRSATQSVGKWLVRSP